MACSVKNCNVDLESILCSIDDGKKKIVLCPNHAVLYALDGIPEKELMKYPSNINEVQKCEICEKKAVLYKDEEVEFHLCKDHLNSLLRRNLLPEEFKKLYSRVGSVFLLHEDFYDPESGEAIQPVE